MCCDSGCKVLINRRANIAKPVVFVNEIVHTLLSVQPECGWELKYNKNVHQPYLHPSYHLSVPVPDVLPDASNSCTLLM